TGRSWVTYSGHGDVDRWADPSFTTTGVHSLTNVDMVPYVQTYACLSGNFTSTSCPECFSESWIRSGRRGGIAHIASSVTSYWTEDDTLERRVFDCMFDSSFFWIMGGFNRAKLIYFRQMGNTGTTRRYLEMYNMMGDGAIDVYAHQPVELQVSHPSVIPIGNYPFSVAVRTASGPVKNALVCAAAHGDTTVFAAGYTDAAGEALLNIQTTAPDTLFVTVTGHDLRPYLGSALVMPAGGAYVLWLRTEADDSAGGNNDRIINPGETINLKMWVKNWGGGQAQNVRTWLRSSDPNITLRDTVKSFGNIGPGDSAFTGPDGFDFTVASSCTNGYRLAFSVCSKDANDSCWQSPLSLFVGAPRLSYSNYEVSDPPPGGNGNRMLDPGEQADMVVTLRNTGRGRAYAVTAILRSGDPRLRVLDSLGSFGEIGPDTTGANGTDRFRLGVDISTPRETRLPCTLYVRTGTQTTICAFEVEVGAIRTCDPIPDGPRTPARYYAYDITDTLYDERPVFSWVEIRGIGTRLNLGDDQTQTVSLPARFGPWNYYGQSYTQISICSNGWIAPGTTSYTAYTNTTLPNTAAPPMVCLSWDDYDPRYGGGIWWYHDTLNHRFIVEYDSVEYVSSSAWDKFEVIIYDTTVARSSGDNVILVQYKSANNYSSCTAGLQDQTRTVIIQCLYNGTYHRGAASFVPGMAVKYTTAPPTGIRDMSAGDMTPGFGLAGAFPNPFRTHTAIGYRLSADGPKEIRIYDASGRLVRALSAHGSGRESLGVVWDGRDSQGRRCSRGVYLCRLEPGVEAESVKLVMVE
ncbi:MAG: C25 family cysteine peptidase, partial [candidate division WOR-3 bacterium]